MHLLWQFEICLPISLYNLIEFSPNDQITSWNFSSLYRHLFCNGSTIERFSIQIQMHIIKIIFLIATQGIMRSPIKLHICREHAFSGWRNKYHTLLSCAFNIAQVIRKKWWATNTNRNKNTDILPPPHTYLLTFCVHSAYTVVFLSSLRESGP